MRGRVYYHTTAIRCDGCSLALSTRTRLTTYDSVTTAVMLVAAAPLCLLPLYVGRLVVCSLEEVVVHAVLQGVYLLRSTLLLPRLLQLRSETCAFDTGHFMQVQALVSVLV